ncbi:uncharacterized protein LOC115883334 [Sitophilus oryzae]|uniref:Uncharacterized protein LOC115883334 n=1 Tax=Sitophilus oryzae TaxID=7048 RepID=A0A6J2Y2Q2_SITOR|nr:uncharacterized protein LOC115883334 [Sitophilus oryzae]
MNIKSLYPVLSYFFFLFLIIGCNAAGDFSEKVMRDNMEQCVHSSGVSAEDIKNLEKLTTPNHNQNCFAKCLVEKLGFITPSGDIDMDKVKKEDELHELSPELMKCLGEVGKIQGCDDMLKVFECKQKYM